MNTECIDYDAGCNPLASILFLHHATSTTASTITCPANFTVVPFNSSVGTTSDFCVATYEMRNVALNAVSQSTGTLWTTINQNDARTKCLAMGSGYHLITNAERMTIARNIEANAANWTGGAVGSGKIFTGHSDQDPIASCNDSILEFVEGNCFASGGAIAEEKRTHTLSNQEVIWDFAGNVWEWTDWLIVNNRATGCLAAAFFEFPTCTPTAAMLANSFQSLNAGFNSTQGIGQYWGDVDGTKGASSFGGDSSAPAGAGGVYALSHGADPTDTSGLVGFRCAWSP